MYVLAMKFHIYNSAHMGGINMHLLGYLVHILVLQATVVFGLTYHMSLNVDVNYEIKNNEYPDYYKGANHSVLVITSPYSARITLSCPVIDIPSTDSFLVEARGYHPMEWRGQLPQYQYFTVDQINITTSTAYNTRGGRFDCLITASADPGHTTTTTTTTTTTPPTTTMPSTQQCDCGWRHVNRIVGGQETGVNEYPFMAGVVDLVKRMLICGGTIISESFVITAGHCVFNISALNFAILVGEHNTELGNESAYTRIYQVDAYQIHESYVDGTSPNDIAILRTELNIEFSVAVGPVCLPYTLWVNDGTYDVTELGWGTTEFGGRTSDSLQEVTLSTITNYQCEQAYGRSISYSQICTFSQGKDSCQYDSGGPVVYFDPTRQRYKYIGIITYGQGCADNYPGVCTRIQSFIPWIEYHTGVTFCRK